MLKQRLQQKLLQKLSPQQIQLIKLLEVPTIQLEQRIKKEIEENPVLEEGKELDSDSSSEDQNDNQEENEREEFSFEDYLDEDDIPSCRLNPRNYSKGDEKNVDIPFTGGVSFRESLDAQLGYRKLEDHKHSLGQYILGNIDDDGYLRRDLENIVDDLAFSMNIMTSEQELAEILTIVQDFDPAGVGARNLKECLLLQVDRIIEDGKNGEKLLLARKILEDYFTEFKGSITIRFNRGSTLMMSR